MTLQCKQYYSSVRYAGTLLIAIQNTMIEIILLLCLPTALFLYLVVFLFHTACMRIGVKNWKDKSISRRPSKSISPKRRQKIPQQTVVSTIILNYFSRILELITFRIPKPTVGTQQKNPITMTTTSSVTLLPTTNHDPRAGSAATVDPPTWTSFSPISSTATEYLSLSWAQTSLKVCTSMRIRI